MQIINKLSIISLRKCGLSRMKVKGIKDICKKNNHKRI